MTCAEFDRLTEDSYFPNTTRGERAAVAKHYAECETCRAMIDGEEGEPLPAERAIADGFLLTDNRDEEFLNSLGEFGKADDGA